MLQINRSEMLILHSRLLKHVQKAAFLIQYLHINIIYHFLRYSGKGKEKNNRAGQVSESSIVQDLLSSVSQVKS